MVIFSAHNSFPIKRYVQSTIRQHNDNINITIIIILILPQHLQQFLPSSSTTTTTTSHFTLKHNITNTYQCHVMSCPMGWYVYCDYRYDRMDYQSVLCHGHTYTKIEITVLISCYVLSHHVCFPLVSPCPGMRLCCYVYRYDRIYFMSALLVRTHTHTKIETITVSHTHHPSFLLSHNIFIYYSK